MLHEPSLGAGVAALLEARGERELGALVRRSIVEVVGRGERWSMGAREVAVHRIALVVSASDHVLLSSSAARLALVRDAFAAAVRTPETELENLSLVLALPPSQTGFHHGYRDAPLRAPETPGVDSVLSGAKALCAAENDEMAARALDRATLEDGYVTTGPRSVRKFVLRLDAADFSRAEKDRDFGDTLLRAVRTAAVTATETTTAVHIGVRLVDAELPADHETWFVQALARKSAVAVPIERNDKRTRFAVVYREELFVLELNKQKSASWFKKSASVDWESDSTPTAVVAVQTIESTEVAESTIGAILQKIVPG